MKEYPIDKYFDPPENRRQYVLISIKFPNEMLDRKAHEMNISANLCNTFSHVYVKGDFSLHHRDSFMCFDADERQDIISEIFEEQIDFKYYLNSQIIESHFPLHKRDVVKEL